LLQTSSLELSMGVEAPHQRVDRINYEAEAERGPDDRRPYGWAAWPLIAFGVGALVCAALAVWLIFRDVH
jgi:hypothetical protein